MSNAVFLSYARETEPWLDDLAGYTHSVGLGITGRFVPVGGAFELVPGPASATPRLSSDRSPVRYLKRRNCRCRDRMDAGVR